MTHLFFITLKFLLMKFVIGPCQELGPKKRQFQVHLDISKNDNGKFQNWKVDQSIYEIQQVNG